MNTNLEETFINFWRDLVRASHDSKHPFRYSVLATYHDTLGISQRTVVVRKVMPEENRLLFYSDYRTQKVEAIQQHCKANLLFYNPKTRVQLRVTGEITLHRKDGLTEELWSGMELQHTKDYGSTKAPGTEIENTPSYFAKKEERYENFSVLNFQANFIDYLRLDRNQHERVQYKKIENNWVGQSVIP